MSPLELMAWAGAIAVAAIAVGVVVLVIAAIVAGLRSTKPKSNPTTDRRII